MRSNSILRLSLISVATLLSACGGGSDTAVVPEETRLQDSRIDFAVTAADAQATTFAAISTQSTDTVDVSTTSRWVGVLGGAGYRIEVPANWNGKLVMYAHGFAGNGNVLSVNNPQIRRYLIQNGYAWAASSYTKNYYDVRAGVEDTNALALEFNKIANARGRTLAAPSKIYITGVSMGGHITAAAIEAETAATAIHKVKYSGAVPMCGVVGDTELFDTFAAMQVSAQAVAGVANNPVTKWSDIQDQVTNALFTTFPSTPTTLGTKYVSILQNLTGGPRPLFAQGLAFGGSFAFAYGTFGSDGTVTGILNKNVLDTNRYTYVIDGDAAGSASINATVQKLTATPDANRLRTDGLRWIPKVNGEFKIPVVTIHTLGDLFVPFNMEQVYQKRVAAKGNSAWLVQRAIRGASHCDFTVAESETAFDDMIKWERDGIKPLGDDVVTPAVVAATSYGCKFTKNTIGPDDTATTTQLRAGIAQTTPACSGSFALTAAQY
ncbi:o-phthalyl amidase [Polaromonas vacuolata]|uniref:O-phthalyl amidase n=1 Tax=Polaromonas vacuolata TaxID=37448 RepID=A0A6H2H733_9BURK|nr:alpha/beta hydrolase [Polaromonas vacuolata]QJC55603.1 o-phthalyl amidase [Polaromonas vacuolata]